jgi:hypothetical protein
VRELDVRASQVVKELKPHWENVMKIQNNPNLSPKDKEEKFAQILKQMVQALDKYSQK